MWIRDHEPSVYSATDKTLQAKDYIVYKMTGVLATDYSDASGTNAFDLVHKCWSNPILRAVKIDPSLFPESYPSTTVIGRVTREAAALTGLQEGTPVVLGGGDGSCAIVGAGIYGRQKAYAILGSSSWIAFETDSPLDDEEMRFMTWAHLEDGKYEPCGTMQAAGLSIEWIKDVLANSEGFEQLEMIASHAPPGSKNLLYLPYLLGERSPRWDPNAKGCFIGLTSKHSRADIFRSVYEGIAYNLKTILNIFSDKVDLNDITLIGGGAKSTLWRHVLADVWAKPVKIPRYLEEATSIGAAIAGGVGVGLFKDFSICKQCNPILENIEPVIQNSQLYERLYPLFEASYRNLKEVFHELGEYQK
jgi:xylulokinase